MINIEDICKAYKLSDINNVDNENSFFNNVFSLQQELLNKTTECAYKLFEINETHKQVPTLDRRLITYDKELTLLANTITIKISKAPTEDNSFVNENYIDAVSKNKYQRYDEVSVVVSQKILNSLDGTISPLLNDSYFLQNYLNNNNITLTDCSVTKTDFSQTLEDGQLIGFLDCQEYIVKVDDIIDLSSKSVRNLNNNFALNSSYLLVGDVSVEEANIVSIYLKQSNYYLNNKDTYDKYVTNSNLYLSNAVMSDELSLNSNIKKTIDVYNQFDTLIASKDWEATDLIKTDSNQTGIVDALSDSIENNTELTSNEVISYEELKAVLSNVTDKLSAITGECNG